MKKQEFLKQIEKIASEMDAKKAARFKCEVYHAKERGQSDEDAIVTGWMVSNGDCGKLAKLVDQSAGVTNRADGMAEILDTIPSHKDRAIQYFIEFNEFFDEHGEKIEKMRMLKPAARRQALARFKKIANIKGEFDDLQEVYLRYKYYWN